MTSLTAASHLTPTHPASASYERTYSASTANTRSHLSPTAGAETDFGSPIGRPAESSPLSQATTQQHGRFNEEWEASQRGSSVVDGPSTQRSGSGLSNTEITTPSRSGTLKKRASLRRRNSLGRSGASRRSSRAGSVRSLALEPDGDEMHSAFYSPVPTTGNPTEILANRFSAWRKFLKDLIVYFREVQNQYEQKHKNLLKISNLINNTTAPSIFMSSGGINDALEILRNHHKAATIEANRAKSVENDVVLALTGLRSDLQQKIKEIKNLSGDFKNSVEKEMENTRRTVQVLGEALGQADVDPAQMTGKQDPYLLRLAADRQLERQIDEENYLHQAYLNLESSGRELESIVVGEIQKAYNALAGIVRREADEAYNAVESLRSGPIALPKDVEWNDFIVKDEHFVDPRVPVRQPQNIYYPGRDHELASEVRAGLLERKSKYLKSYTAGWYVLSPTHLHEFKSADKTQAPIMSLYLPDQKLGSHSVEGSSSNKFILKGRQTGSLHRGHSWVFRAETYDTMMAWYEDIKTLTEKSPAERSVFVRAHARSFSSSSNRAASVVSSDGVVDEEDDEPFASASAVVTPPPRQDVSTKRPQPGGRFPSDLQVNAERGLQLSPSSGSSFGDNDIKDRDIVAAAADLPGSGVGQHYERRLSPTAQPGHGASMGSVEPTHASELNRYAKEDGVNPYTATPIDTHDYFTRQTPEAGSSSRQHTPSTAQAEAHREHVAENAPEVAVSPESAGLSEVPRASEVSRAESSSKAPTVEQPEHTISLTEYLSGPTAGADPATPPTGQPAVSPLTPTPSEQVTENINNQTVQLHLRGGSDTPSDKPDFNPPEEETTPADSSAADTPLPSPLPESMTLVTGADVDLPLAAPVESPLATPPAEIHTSVPPAEVEAPKRPTLGEIMRAGQHHESVATIRQLHVPGSFPGSYSGSA